MFSCNIYSITSQNLFHIQAELVMLLNYPRTESILSQIESEPCVLELKWFRQWVGIRSSNHYDIIGGISFICFIMFLYLVKQWVAGTVALGPFKPRDLCYNFMLFKFNICTDVSPPPPWALQGSWVYTFSHLQSKCSHYLILSSLKMCHGTAFCACSLFTYLLYWCNSHKRTTYLKP